MWSLLWATHGLPCRVPVYRGCPCRDPPVCHRVQGDSVAKRQPFFVWLLVLLESRHHVFVRVPRVSRDVITTGCSSCATENTHTPARLEALFKFSVATILSHSYHFAPTFSCGLWVLSPTRHLVKHVLHLVREPIEILACLLLCSVASHLVHVNANQFLSRKIDQFRMLSRLSLDITAIFSTGYTLVLRDHLQL